MARRIEHRSVSARPAAEVFQALIDPGYLADRLAELGGTNAVLVKHARTADGAHFQIRHGLRTESLPMFARAVVGGERTIAIDRSESWRCDEEGHYTGEIAAEIAGTPCSITVALWLRDLIDPEGPSISELVVSGSVKVSVPFVGARVEDLVADQVQKLLIDEENFTMDWLARQA